MHIKPRPLSVRLAIAQMAKRLKVAFLSYLCATLSLWSGLSNGANADWIEDIDFNKLVAIVGSSLPNGSGVPISLVEAIKITKDGGGTVLTRSYKPDPSLAQFLALSDPNMESVTFIDGSNNDCGGASTPCIGFSTHAGGQAQNFFGNTKSISPAANLVTLYEANDYLESVLRAPNGAPPISQNFRVQNFSWVGDYDDTPSTPRTPTELANNISALRRFDFLIERDNVTAVVGLNNGATKPVPPLLAQSYNAIALGVSDADHSTGFTDLPGYGLGRSKPDLVMPQTTTSTATSSTSSVAAFLHSVVAGTDAAKSETMKAILMAGATKNEFPAWSRTTTQPLDVTYGAGEVNVYNSYVITQGGRFAGDSSVPTPVASHGWDYQTITGGSELKYLFSIPEGSTATELSILLDWNIDIPTGFNSQTLADFSLDLKDSLGQSIQASNSPLDNVEHLYLTNLGPGEYTLSVSSNMTHDFGLAWRTSTLFDIASADFDEDGDVDGRDFLAWQRGYGKLLGATHAEGDADGDGDVDSDDIMIFHAQFNPPIALTSALIHAVPEPSSIALATGGILFYLLKRRRRGGAF